MQPYIKQGQRIGLTIRQLGYPTKNALKTWYRESEQSHELRNGYTRPVKFSQRPGSDCRTSMTYADLMSRNALQACVFRRANTTVI